MKKLTKIMSVIFIFISITGLSNCNHSAKTTQKIEIPFEIYAYHLFIQLKINNGSTKTFMFDSGASTATLDTKVAKELGLPINYQQSISGLGSTQKYSVSSGHEVSLNNQASIPKVDFTLIDLRQSIRGIGKHFDGIIGFEILNQYITEFDYDRMKMILHTRESFKQIDKSLYTEIPFYFKNGINIPQFDISFALANGDTFSGMVFFDTGADITLNINAPFDQKHQLSTKIKEIQSQAFGLGIASNINLGAIQSLSFDEFELKEMIISISTGNKGVSALPNYMGIIGSQIINRFHFILDYTNKKLYMKPNKLYAEPFRFPKIAMKLEWVNNQVQIAHVFPNTEAEALGFQQGQKILAINEYRGNDLATCRELLSQEGKEVNILIEDKNGQQREIHTILKELFK